MQKAIDKYSQWESDTIDYDAVAEDLKALSGTKYVVFNERMPASNLIVTRAIAGVAEDIKKASAKVGVDLIGATWEPDAFVEKASSSRGLQQFGDLSEVAARQIPKIITQTVGKMFGVDSIYGFGLNRGSRNFGYILFLTGKEAPPKNIPYLELLKTYVESEIMCCRFKRLEEKKYIALPFTEAAALKIPDILYQLDSEGRIVFVNNSVTRYGYEREELIGKNIFDIVHPEDHQKAEYRINERRTGDRHTRGLEIRLQTRKKRPVYFSIQGRSIEIDPVFRVEAEGLYESDTPKTESFKGTVGIARDITEHKALEIEIAEKEELFRGITENIEEVIWVEQLSPRRVLYINPAIEQIYGITAEDAYRDPDYWMEFLHPEDKPKILDALRNNDLIDRFFEYRIIVDGEEKWIRSRLFPLTNQNIGQSELGVGLAENITALKRREEELAKSLETNEMLIKEIYHRVKNNLMIVESILSLQVSELQEGDTKTILSQVRSRIQTIGIIHEMLYRSENYRLISIREYLEQLCTYLTGSLLNSRDKIRLEADICEGRMGAKKAITIGLIVTELFINAVKYAFPYTEEGIVRVELKKNTSDYYLTVTDNGQGFQSTKIEENEEDTGQPPRQPTRLGMTLVETLVEQLGGTFSIDSQEGLTVCRMHFPTGDAD